MLEQAARDSEHRCHWRARLPLGVVGEDGAAAELLVRAGAVAARAARSWGRGNEGQLLTGDPQQVGRLKAKRSLNLRACP